MKILFKFVHCFLEIFVRPILHKIGYDIVVEVGWVPEKKRDWALMSGYHDLIASYRPANVQCGETPKIIWQFWWQGVELAPQVVKRCFASVREFMSKDYSIVVLDKYNLDQYVEIDPVIREKHDKGIINHTHFSEYVRVKLLSERGGIWIDSTVFLSGRIPNDILTSRFFIFKSGPFAFPEEIPPDVSFLAPISTFAHGSGRLLPSTWFLVSGKGSPIHSLNVKFLEAYWRRENKQHLYFIQHVFITYAICANKYCRQEFVSAPTYLNFRPHYLMFRRDEKATTNLIREIFAASKIHKMTYKFSNVPEECSLLGYLLSGMLLECAKRGL